MKAYVKACIEDYTAACQKTSETKWGTPLVGFADARHPRLGELRKVANENHVMPWEVLPDATVVVCYFVPFTRETVLSNREGRLSSPEWARAYEDTNALFARLNAHLIERLEARGYHAAVSPEATAFDREALRSRWSQRHMAWLAGLGSFGLNNMLITDRGCCGRISTVVTNLDVTPGRPLEVENCLYKRGGQCGVCVKRCPSGALTKAGYDRQKCFGLCSENAAIYRDFGNSYAADAAGEILDTGSEVCGKCLAGVPCAFQKPIKE